MNNIHVLPESVKRKIAAGEVVEGPFSVVKELLENAIDADASVIDIEIDEAGLKRIMVRDNGRGIYREDLPLSIEEHATSKIQSDVDIENICTLGFRGEALSSISSVSRLTILSRSEEEETGGRLVVSGDDVAITDYAGPVGTTVIVENIFFNTPARKKFLKTPSTELRYIREVIFRMALVHPEIDFSITIDGKRAHSLHSAGSMVERIQQVYGKSVAENLVFDRMHENGIAIEGFLSLPSYSRPQRSLQHLYINGRPVFHQYLGFLLQKSYEGLLKRGQHPAAILMIRTAPEKVDVNVHPAKREVRFSDQQFLNRMIMNLASRVLNSRVHQLKMPGGVTPNECETARDGTETVVERVEDYVPDPGAQQRFGDYSSAPVSSNVTGKAIDLEITGTSDPVAGNSYLHEISDLYVSLNEWGDDVHVLGIVFGTYVLVERDNEILIIDFHATHERMLYDRIINSNAEVETQQLAFPKVIELTPEIHQDALDSLEYLNKNGFDIEDFSDNSLIIRGIPSFAAHVDPGKTVLEILDSIGSVNDVIEDIRKSIAETLACHAARRANDELSPDEIIRIIRYVSGGNGIMRCPHGRPLAYALGKNEIERFFKRS
mgnify:CR=1 FL=1